MAALIEISLKHIYNCGGRKLYVASKPCNHVMKPNLCIRQSHINSHRIIHWQQKNHPLKIKISCQSEEMLFRNSKSTIAAAAGISIFSRGAGAREIRMSCIYNHGVSSLCYTYNCARVVCVCRRRACGENYSAQRGADYRL
jgi:hypothetical protein